MISTIYNLLAPLAVIKILQNTQNRLTSVDLAVDPSINAIYLIAKDLYRTFSADKDLADIEPRIQYDLYVEGIFAGYLDIMTEELIEYYYEPDKTPRLKSFGKFWKDYVIETDTETSIKYPFDLAYEVFLNFHPKTKPVLWRILIAQLYLYYALFNIYEWKTKERMAISELPKDFKPIKDIPELHTPKDLDWRHHPGDVPDKEVLVDPYNAVKKYLSTSRVQHLMENVGFYKFANGLDTYQDKS